MPSMDSLLGLAVGLALSTAAGLRVFVPLQSCRPVGPLHAHPRHGLDRRSDTALIAFATATVLEVGGHYVP